PGLIVRWWRIGSDDPAVYDHRFDLIRERKGRVEPDEPRIAMHENKVKVGAQQLHCLPSTRYVSPLLQNVTDRRSDAGARFLAMSSFEQWQQFEAHLPPAEGKCFHQQHAGTALFESRKQRLCAASLDCGGGGF